MDTDEREPCGGAALVRAGVHSSRQTAPESRFRRILLAATISRPGDRLAHVSSVTQLIVSALVRRDGQILLVEEAEPGDPGPTWMLPGGRVEPSETLIQALRRELAEETGMGLLGSPVIAFAVDITAPEGQYSAITFDCQADGSLAPDDPDGLVLSAAWLTTDEALARLACVAWYDCLPLERFLSGEGPPGATYVADRT
jgi:ADP-ribose pyrophosphatase YjhB (NUDIX family)